MCPIVFEWVYAREVLRRLGFLPDELFFSVSNSSVISLVLKTQNKDFIWTIGVSKLPPDALVKMYEELCETLNSGGEWDVVAFHASLPYLLTEAVSEALQDKGFILPILGETINEGKRVPN